MPVSKRNKRTRAQVLAAQQTVMGCCARHADNQCCTCLAEAEPDSAPISNDATLTHNATILHDIVMDVSRRIERAARSKTADLPGVPLA